MLATTAAAALVWGMASSLPAAQTDSAQPDPMIVAQATIPELDEGASRAEPSPAPVRYTPPRTGRPLRRNKVTSNNRGSAAPPQPHTLAPEHVAHTTRAQPVLFWWVDEWMQELPESVPQIVFTLIESEGLDPDPVCELYLPAPARPGLQRIDTKDCGDGLELDAQTEYDWSVSVIADADKRALDRVEKGWIKRVPTTESGTSDARSLAAQGLWYDAAEQAVKSGDAGTWSALVTALGRRDLPMH